jgi:hypothetical protein
MFSMRLKYKILGLYDYEDYEFYLKRSEACFFFGLILARSWAEIIIDHITSRLLEPSHDHRHILKRQWNGDATDMYL